MNIRKNANSINYNSNFNSLAFKICAPPSCYMLTCLYFPNLSHFRIDKKTCTLEFTLIRMEEYKNRSEVFNVFVNGGLHKHVVYLTAAFEQCHNVLRATASEYALEESLELLHD